MFVDNEGRQYRDFDAWRTENRLPPGQFTFPADGHLNEGEAGRALTVTAATPRTVDTVQEWALQAGDTVALVGGLVVAAAAVVGSGGTLLPVTAAALAGWGAMRSGGSLVDRVQHGQTLSLADPEARAEWLNLGASGLTLAALGSGALARAVANGGSRYTATIAGLARTVDAGADLADAATMLDLGHTLLTNPDLPAEEKLAIVAQIAFWGAATTLEPRAVPGEGIYSLEAVEQRLRAPADAGPGGTPDAQGPAADTPDSTDTANPAPDGVLLPGADVGRPDDVIPIPVPPPASGVNLPMQESLVAGMREAGVIELGIRDTQGSIWHGVGGDVQLDDAQRFTNPGPAPATQPEIAEGRPVFPDRPLSETGALYPTKPGGAVTLTPAVMESIDAARAAQGLPPLREVFPDLPLPVRVGTDEHGQALYAQQQMFGGAKPVIIDPVYDPAGRVIDGDLLMVVSDVDIVYARGADGRLLDDDAIAVLAAAINRSYAARLGLERYDIVNHGAQFNYMQPPTLERYDLDKPAYWNGPVYTFRPDTAGYSETRIFGDVYHEFVDSRFVPRWQRGGPRPE
jgi:hypothetical protein